MKENRAVAVGDYARVRERLAQFWKVGIRGADFFMSASGPAVEVFGRYVRVVENCRSQPRLYPIPHPAATLQPVEVREVVRYIIEDWKDAARA